MSIRKSIPPALLAAVLLAVSPAASAKCCCDKCVVSAINALHQSMVTLLTKLGIQMVVTTDEIVHTIDETSRIGREADIALEADRRKDSHRLDGGGKQNCANSLTGNAVNISNNSAMYRGSLRPGGGAKVADPDIRHALEDPAPPVGIDASRATKIYAKYCDYDDHKAFGGAQACPAVNTDMPGAPKRIDSLIVGAGPADRKKPDLQFTQEQEDVARMYTQNTVRRSVAPQLAKGEADSAAGSKYVGLAVQYNALLSAAAQPQDAIIADSKANEETKEMLEQAMESPSTKKFFEKWAGDLAKKNQVLSTREFEEFEVMRRYANIDYQADLQEMSPDNLVREQIRIANFQNYMLLKIRDEMRMANIIAGQQLAIQGRREFTPLLLDMKNSVEGRLGSN